MSEIQVGKVDIRLGRNTQISHLLTVQRFFKQFVFFANSLGIWVAIPGLLC